MGHVLLCSSQGKQHCIHYAFETLLALSEWSDSRFFCICSDVTKRNSYIRNSDLNLARVLQPYGSRSKTLAADTIRVVKWVIHF